MFEAIIAPLKAFAENTIHNIGYLGIFLLMMLDSANIPIPSEVIMPTGGMLAQAGKMNFHAVAFAGGIGSAIGSLINYWIGARLGKPFLLKYGKYMLIRAKEVEHGEDWFKKYGLWVTLWGRFIPLVRTFISLPAGIYRANFPIFTLNALIGGLGWAYLWTYIGIKMAQNWSVVESNMKIIDVIVVAAFAFLLIRHIMKLRAEKAEAKTSEVSTSE